jgi:hypothetical protein
MNIAQTETDLIRLWINSLSIDFKNSSETITLSDETLKTLLKQLIIFFISKDTTKGHSLKYIKKKEKNTLEIRVKRAGFNSILETFFYKKQINSNWTYLKFRDYRIKWNCAIHLNEDLNDSDNKKKPNKEKQNKEKQKSVKTPIIKKQFNKFSDYFEKEE